MAITELKVGHTYKFDANNSTEDVGFLNDEDTIITILSTEGRWSPETSETLPIANIDYVFKDYEHGYIAVDSVRETAMGNIYDNCSFIFTPTRVGSDGAAGFPYITEIKSIQLKDAQGMFLYPKTFANLIDGLDEAVDEALSDIESILDEILGEDE